MQDLSRAQWRKSSHSGSGGQCVEVALNIPGTTAIRDSKDPHGPAFVLGQNAWSSFLAAVKYGELGRE